MGCKMLTARCALWGDEGLVEEQGMSERRSKERHTTEPIAVSSPTLRGQVLNLSIDGLAIETATPLRPGKKVSLKIDGEGTVVFGSVRWSKLKTIRTTVDGDSEAIYHAGIAIDEQEKSSPPSPGDDPD